MPKSHRTRHRRRRHRLMSLAGGAGGASYVTQMAGDGPTQFKNVYENPSHTNSPTGGGLWLENGTNVAYQAPAGATPLMSGGRRRGRTQRKSNRRRYRGKKTCKSWLSKLF